MSRSPPAPHTAAAAPQPWRRLAALAGAVLAAHALLIAWWAPGARQVGSGHGPAPRPVLLVPPPAAVPGAVALAPVAAAPQPAAPAPPTVAAAQPLPGPQRPGDAPGAAPADTAVPGEAVSAMLPRGPAAPASQPAIELDPEAEAGAPPPPAEGAPPPVYATRMPLPALLRYRVLSTPGGAAAAPAPLVGEARLLLRHDGQRYTLQLDAQAGGRPLIEQQSIGGFDSAGFAPERFTDRRRGRGWRAANFRRDIGRIGFSGPRIDYPLLPGTQDRLSAVAQLAAIVAAAPDTAAAGELRVFVADARGWAELWRWRAEGSETVDTPLGPLTLARWRREPERPEGLRVEAWLDPARGHWPARLRYTLLRNGQVLDLLLAAEPAPPP